VPAPPALRLLTGGTAPDDVAALRTALAERLALRGLLTTRDGLPAPAAEDGEHRTGLPLPLLVPIAPGEDEGLVRADLARRITRVPARTDLILRTSGSTTGTGRLIAMSAAALAAPPPPPPPPPRGPAAPPRLRRLPRPDTPFPPPVCRRGPCGNGRAPSPVRPVHEKSHADKLCA